MTAAEVTPPPSPEERSRLLREAIRSVLPKYADKPAADRDQSMEVSGQAEERNGVLHLGKVTVRSRNPMADLTPEQMMTPAGRLEEARKRNPAIKVGNILGLNNGIALFMLQEDVDVAKKNALKERVRRATIVVTPETKQTDELLKAALARPDMHWAGQGKP